MASPQVEDGYTKIANELLEAIMRYPFTANELRVILFILRKSYGWREKVINLRISEIAFGTGIPKQNINRILKSLMCSSCLLCNQVDYKVGISVGIQKDYDRWYKRTKKCKKVIKLITKSNQVETSHLLYKKRKKGSIEEPSKKPPPKKQAPLKGAPSNFPITDKMRAYAKRKGYTGDLEHLTEKFLKRHSSKGNKFRDWYKAWQNWLLQEKDYHPERFQAQQGNGDRFGGDNFLKTAWNILSNPGYSEQDFIDHCKGYGEDPDKVKKKLRR